MSLWMVIVLLGLVKLPVAALMLWIPFRNDQAMSATAAADADGAGGSEDDGGSMALRSLSAQSPSAVSPPAPTPARAARLGGALLPTADTPAGRNRSV